MTDTKYEQYWTDFTQTGSISSYLKYKGITLEEKATSSEEAHPIGSYRYRGDNNKRN